ncbi:sigma-54-dependent Fis family transcriptional regulator [Saltatorellus ferox]|uniref:sigma-54-dependent Fis family transcriptional regulator n=1 Tax=Saltatorellus ferox TaxID=2528018 RepID=UPI003AF34181
MTFLPRSTCSDLLRLTPPRAEIKLAVLTGLVQEGVEAPLLATWNRSRELGADADGSHALEEGVLDASTLAAARARSEGLRRHASSVLGGFAAACEASDFVAVLADADGVVVDTFGGGAFAREAERLRLIEGAAWGESLRGTNAIGTALAENRPVAVYGAAHFARVNEGLVCFAAPIRDPRGEIVGVLDATSRAERANAFDIGIVVSMARAIEEVLRAREYARASGGIDLVERLMERSHEPAFLVERPGRVVRADARARALMQEIRDESFLPDWPALVARASIASELRVHLSPTRGEVSQGQVAALDLIVEPITDGRGDILALMVFAAPVVAEGFGQASLPAAPRHAAIRRRTPRPPTAEHAFERILGSDPALETARTTCARLARSRLPVLLLAETGAGKELFARAIHDASPRAAAPYVPVNCGAIQPALLLSELFGHGPGAYTGAARGGRDGLIATAHGGTLFLDEVADLSGEAQVALLRVLEDGTYFRVGESTQRTADIRIVAATSRDLHALVAASEFREDLFFRIGGACVELPPLRQREDIAELASELWSRMLEAQDAGSLRLSPAALEAIAAHDWPGNVRELESALEFAVAMAGEEVEVTPAHLPPTLKARGRALPRRAGAGSTGSSGIGLPALDAARHAALLEALETSNGNVSEAARKLGVARSTVYRLGRRLGLDSLR